MESVENDEDMTEDEKRQYWDSRFKNDKFMVICGLGFIVVVIIVLAVI